MGAPPELLRGRAANVPVLPALLKLQGSCGTSPLQPTRSEDATSRILHRENTFPLGVTAALLRSQMSPRVVCDSRADPTTVPHRAGLNKFAETPQHSLDFATH